MHSKSSYTVCGSWNRQVSVESISLLAYGQREPGFFSSGEVHNSMELIFVEQGSIHCLADGREMILQPGELVLYAPGQWHMEYADIDTTPLMLSICFDIQEADHALLPYHKIAASQAALPLLQQIIQEQERIDDYSPDLILALLTLVLLTLCRESSAKSQHATPVLKENRIVLRAQQYIHAHIREDLSVPTMARSVNVSPSYLTALFHKHLHLAPGEYIRRAKLEESKRLIRAGKMNFTEIAAQLQYSTVHHFSRQFKEKFGITPTQYAALVR